MPQCLCGEPLAKWKIDSSGTSADNRSRLTGAGTKCSPSTAKRNTYLGICCGSPGSDSGAALGIGSDEVVAVVPADQGNQLTHWRQMQAGNQLPRYPELPYKGQNSRCCSLLFRGGSYQPGSPGTSSTLPAAEETGANQRLLCCRLLCSTKIRNCQFLTLVGNPSCQSTSTHISLAKLSGKTEAQPSRRGVVNKKRKNLHSVSGK